LSIALDKDLVPDDNLTLKMMLDMNIMEDFDKVESIAVVAKKEHSLEKQLKAMIGEWGEIAFLVKAYKESGTFVIGGTDDITMLLDDQVRNAYMNQSLYDGALRCVLCVLCLWCSVDDVVHGM
jgi:hypothetical protein